MDEEQDGMGNDGPCVKRQVGERKVKKRRKRKSNGRESGKRGKQESIKERTSMKEHV